MTLEIDSDSESLHGIRQRERHQRARGLVAGVTGALPPMVAFTERAAAILRAYLRRQGLRNYEIFYSWDLDLHDIDDHLSALAEQGAAWQPLPAMVTPGLPVTQLRPDENRRIKARKSGVLRLTHHQVVLAHWFWVEPVANKPDVSLWLCAAPSPDHYARLRQDVHRLRSQGKTPVWQIVSGDAYLDQRILRAPQADETLVLCDELRVRLETDVVRFFSDEIAAMYHRLAVPYRRGILLHGPPGNGKTSMIRWIGGRLPRVGAMLLRPRANFDSDDLSTVVQRWTDQAPSILVIEDLNWLLKTVNVSTFLNLVDGIEQPPTSAGLLLIATTNHPESLDPAINNRPGRFDVVIEVPCPDFALRRRFFAMKLPELVGAELERAIEVTDGLSFSHLQEILRLAGISAIMRGDTARSDDDILSAAEAVRASQDQALRGFPHKCEVPFGLQHLKKLRTMSRCARARRDGIT